MSVKVHGNPMSTAINVATPKLVDLKTHPFKTGECILCGDPENPYLTWTFYILEAKGKPFDRKELKVRVVKTNDPSQFELNWEDWIIIDPKGKPFYGELCPDNYLETLPPPTGLELIQSIQYRLILFLKNSVDASIWRSAARKGLEEHRLLDYSSPEAARVSDKLLKKALQNRPNTFAIKGPKIYLLTYDTEKTEPRRGNVGYVNNSSRAIYVNRSKLHEAVDLFLESGIFGEVIWT